METRQIELEGSHTKAVNKRVTKPLPKQVTYESKNYSISNLDNIKSNSGIKALSFFSGCGGLDIGSELAGVEVISSLDFDVDCLKTLSLNPVFRQCKFSLKDISKVSGLDFTSMLKNKKVEKVIMIGGPPCQPFSKAGYWVGNKARQGMNDPRNMIGEYIRVISEVQPDGFLLENVESLLHPSNKEAVKFIEESIHRLGYYFKMVRANAIEFGVPQKRKRVFFIASKNEFIVNEPTKTHRLLEHESSITSNLLPPERVIDWIGKFNSDKYFEKEEVTTAGTYYKELLEVPPGKNYIALTAAAGYPNPKFVAQKRFWNFLLKLDPEKPSWTLAAQPGPWVGPFHWSSRRLRVPEAAAIQTFPEDYIFYGSRRSVQKQIGNAVPPLLGKAMVNFLVANL